jgi:hypothetical protein
MAPRDKIIPIIAFGRRFLVELPPRSFRLSQEISEIWPSDGVTFYMDGSLFTSYFSQTEARVWLPSGMAPSFLIHPSINVIDIFQNQINTIA